MRNLAFILATFLTLLSPLVIANTTVLHCPTLESPGEWKFKVTYHIDLGCEGLAEAKEFNFTPPNKVDMGPSEDWTKPEIKSIDSMTFDSVNVKTSPGNGIELLCSGSYNYTVVYHQKYNPLFSLIEYFTGNEDHGKDSCKATYTSNQYQSCTANTQDLSFTCKSL